MSIYLSWSTTVPSHTHWCCKCCTKRTKWQCSPSLVEWFPDDDIFNVSDDERLRLQDVVLHLNVLNVDWIQLHVNSVQVKVLLHTDTHTHSDHSWHIRTHRTQTTMTKCYVICLSLIRPLQCDETTHSLALQPHFITQLWCHRSRDSHSHSGTRFTDELRIRDNRKTDRQTSSWWVINISLHRRVFRWLRETEMWLHLCICAILHPGYNRVISLLCSKYSTEIFFFILALSLFYEIDETVNVFTLIFGVSSKISPNWIICQNGLCAVITLAMWVSVKVYQ